MSDKAWRHDRLVRGYVAAYGGREDARPRPRLEWSAVTQHEGIDLRLGRARVGCAWHHMLLGWIVRHDALCVADTVHPTLRDAAINLRLRFIAEGFDVDDVPDEILGGGA